MAANIIPMNDPALVALVDKVKAGGVVSLADLLELTTAVVPVAEAPVAKVAVPRVITEAQREAMDRLPKVFGQVVPDKPRELVPVEVGALVVERQTLDDVKKMAEARLADITVTVHNHLDAQYANWVETERVTRTAKFASTGEAAPPVKVAPRDEKGHFITAGTAGVEDVAQQFSREVRHGAPSLSAVALEQLATGDPDAPLTHAEYLSMTTQVRVFDESKAMLAIRKKPALVRAIAMATQPGKDGVSIYLRNRK